LKRVLCLFLIASTLLALVPVAADGQNTWSPTAYTEIGLDGWTVFTGSVELGDTLTLTPEEGSTSLLMQKSVNLDLGNANLAFRVRGVNIPTDLTLHIEAVDASGRLCRWVFYRKGSKLEGCEEAWSVHYVSSASPYYKAAGMDLSRVSLLRYRFISVSTDWSMELSDIRAYQHLDLFPNGAVMFTLDGPHRYVSWLEDKLEKVGAAACMATARANLPDESYLMQLYGKGWDVVVYHRGFDYSSPPELLPIDVFRENALGEAEWLMSLGVDDPYFIQCNRHLSTVESQGLFEAMGFKAVKGSGWTSSNLVEFPFYEYYGSTGSLTADLRRVDVAYAEKCLFIWFNHLDGGTYPGAYTEGDVNTIVDYVLGKGMEIVTYHDIEERLEAAYGEPVSDPVNHTLHMVFDGVWTVEADGVVSVFGSRDEVEQYLNVLFMGWG